MVQNLMQLKLWYRISVLAFFINYIFILYLFDVIIICDSLYNFDQTWKALTLKKMKITYNLKWWEYILFHSFNYISGSLVKKPNILISNRCTEMAMELWKCMRTIRQPGPRATPRAAAKGVFARPRSPLARRAAACGAADHLLSGVRSGLPAACCAACPAQPSPAGAMWPCCLATMRVAVVSP